MASTPSPLLKNDRINEYDAGHKMSPTIYSFSFILPTLLSKATFEV